MNAARSNPPSPEVPARVFVVEDEALIAMELRDRLASLGYLVTGSASRGEEALETIVAARPDVVLMDIHLAGRLDGIQTAAELHKSASVPVIFLSAYSDTDLLRQASEVEPFGYLVKPFEQRELHATIQMALYKHRMEQALRESNARLDEKVRERTAELAQSRENLAVTLNSIGDAVLATDTRGRITQMNPIAERLTGWTRADAVGQPIAQVFRIINEITRSPAVMPVDEVLATGEIHMLANHTVLITRSGAELSITDSAAPIRDAGGRVIGVVLVFRDESEARARRKLIERQGAMLGALRRVQEQFINSPEDSQSFDDILSVLLHSTGSEFGLMGEVLYTPQGRPYLKTQAMADIASAEDSQRAFARYGPAGTGIEFPNLGTLIGEVMNSARAVIANDPPGDASLGGLWKGHPPLTAFLGAPISIGGRVVGMIGVANRRGGYNERVLAEIQPLLATYGSLIVARRNALQRRAAENSLRELNVNLEAEVQRRAAALLASERRYFDLVERINDALVRDDIEGRLVYANHHFLEWFGLECRELHQIVLEDYVAPEWRQVVRSLHDRRIRGEQVPDRFEFEGMGPSGRRMWLDAFVTHVMENERIVGTQAVYRDITERKKTDEALRRSLAMFETLATLSPVGIFHTDASGECLYANRRCCDIGGISQTEALGKGWLRTLHPDDRQRVLAEWGATINYGTAFNSDYRFVRPDGQITWVLGQAVPTIDAQGHTSGYIGTVTDVTEQKQMEGALRVVSTELVAAQGEAFYHLLVRRLAASVDCEIAMVAQFTPGETDSLRALSMFEDGRIAGNPSDPTVHAPCMEVSGGRPVMVTSAARERHPQNAYLEHNRIESYAAVPLTDHAGDLVGCLGVMSRRPLSHPQRVEAILHIFGISASAEILQQRSARRFHDLFEFSPDAIVMTDRSGTIRLVNRKAETMFGWTRDELIGRGVETLMSPDTRTRHVGQRDQYVRSAASRPMGSGRPDLRAQRKNGTAFPVDISLGSIETDEGLMIAAAVRDITDRKNAERQASRTQRLESIGTLAGGIAHDLNNALSPILMMLDILKEKYPAEADLLQTVENSANHASQMVRHLLSFAKGSEGRRMALHPRQLIEDMVQIVKGTFPKNIHVQVRVAKALPNVLGDATQLHQVLLNLCVNARDAMPDGGTLTLEAETADSDMALAMSPSIGTAMPRRYVVLRVTDTGGGVPPEIVDRIFDPFFTTKGPEAGTGLGLFTAAGIVKGHDGFIRVESRESHGSAFAVYLPAAEQGTDARVDKTSGQVLLGNGETILYVDDERNVRDAVQEVLRRLNFVPLLAEDGVSGLAKAVQQRDTLRAVITDLHMPHMDGLTFVRALRRELPDIPVIVASGRAEGPAAAELEKLGVTVTLDKPFTQALLSQALQAALRGS